MTITTDKMHFSDGYRAAIEWDKSGHYSALLFHDNGSGILQNSDIQLSRNYPTREAAKRAIMRRAAYIGIKAIK